MLRCRCPVVAPLNYSLLSPTARAPNIPSVSAKGLILAPMQKQSLDCHPLQDLGGIHAQRLEDVSNHREEEEADESDDDTVPCGMQVRVTGQAVLGRCTSKPFARGGSYDAQALPLV